MIKKWKKKSSKYLLNNKIFKMREDLVTSPKLGSDHSVWVMEVPTWVNIIPITTDGEVILVNQYRFGMDKSSLEIPGGVLNLYFLKSAMSLIGFGNQPKASGPTG